MTRDELEATIGNGEESFSNDNKYQYLNYPNYGVEYEFDKEGLLLTSIHLSSFYEISNLRQGVSLENVMDILGKKNVEVIDSEDSGSSYLLRYEYQNFVLIVRQDVEYSDGTYWQIKRES
jgi:hypothetical protein